MKCKSRALDYSHKELHDKCKVEMFTSLYWVN